MNEISDKRLVDLWTTKTLNRGYQYYRKGHVVQLKCHNNLLHGQVKGQRRRPYETTVNINHFLDNQCSCPMGMHCKHVVALIYAWENSTEYQAQAGQIDESTKNKSFQQLSASTTQWLNTIQSLIQHGEHDQEQASSHQRQQANRYTVIYVLSSDANQQNLLSEIYYVRVKKNGQYGRTYPFEQQKAEHIRALDDNDGLILHQMRKKTPSALTRSLSDRLDGEYGQKALRMILRTGRAFWHHTQQPLQWGQAIAGSIQWQMQDNGDQKLICKLDGQSTIDAKLWVADELWYVDCAQGRCGLINTDYNSQLTHALLSLPPVKPTETQLLSEQVKRLSQQVSLPQPQTFQATQEVESQPQPRLYLQLATIKPQYHNPLADLIFNHSDVGKRACQDLPVAKPQFSYNNICVDYSDERSIVEKPHDNVLYRVHRQFDREKVFIEQLAEYGMLTIGQTLSNAIEPKTLQWAYLLEEDHPDNNPFIFAQEIAPKLEAQGWEIVYSPDYPYQIIQEHDLQWYNELTESDRGGWFHLAIGLKINEQESIDILPLIQHLAQHYDPKKGLFHEFQSDQSVYIGLDGNRNIALSVQRAREIFNGLIELYEIATDNKQNQLTLHRSHLAYLAEKSQADHAITTRWYGSERLRNIAFKLAEDKPDQAATLPRDYFIGQLRDYQYEGFNWLQFLRHYGVGGILADDMGLGKTIQVLAHIAKEKQSGRLTRAVLIVCPTTLLFNWQHEINRFCPHLTLMTLHGAKRWQQDVTPDKADIVLTTYALIQRDKDQLLSYTFYLLVMDEAQAIKNHKTKMAQVALQLDAHHRLCLTGTPVENHLGELWSLFNFLMPGFLGNQTRFKQVFRTPIERYQNQSRHEQLSQRIKPFLLRRTKQQVAQEIPAKSEIVHTLEMANKQRDLYESIRVSMKQKVQQAIAEKGLKNSQITILDALLKLRQICCDPRMLPLEQAKNFQTASPKLQALLEIIHSVWEESRQVVVFSQFVKMLELIQQALQPQGISFETLTGETRHRGQAVERFQQGQATVFLVSLKAGGTGLNLTAADTVVHFDPWWNPSVENQATDRTHRIGQNQNVFVYKLLMKGSVEEKVYELQQSKNSLIEGLFNDRRSQGHQICEQDIEQLFQPI